MEENKESKSKNKILTLTILILILIIIAVATGVILYNKGNNINVNENGESITEDQEIEDKNKEIEKVKNALSSYTEDIGSIENLVFDSNYNNDYRFNQTYKGIEVYGGGIVATYNDDQIISLINYNYEIPEDFNVSPLNNSDDLVNVALEHLEYENITPSESELIIYPINLSDFTLAYLYDFNGIKVVISDSNKTVLGTTTIYNGTTIDKSITDIISDGINNTKKNNENNSDSVLKEKNNTTAIEQSITEVFPDIIQKNYDELVKDNKNITQEETKEFIQNDGTYLLKDEERNIEFYTIKSSYGLIPSNKFLEENTEYYIDVKWDSIQEANYDNNYYAIKAMQHLQDVYDYYKNRFQHISIKESEENKLKVYTNFSKVQVSEKEKPWDFSDNACLTYFNEDDIRIYLGSTNSCSDDLEIMAHEYTHGYFNRVVNKMSDNETNSVNEAYSDIMGMIIEAYYENKVLDGIHHEGGGEGFERNIRNSQLKYTDYNEETEYHESSMIVSKIAYLMSVNESLDLDIDELGDIWFKSMYKLPKHYVKFTDVEKAVLLQAKELGYTKEQIRIMADIFVSMGYPDCYDECFGDILNVRKINFLDKDKAIALIRNNNGNTWRDIELEYEYVATVMDENGNSYYAIDRYAKDNFMYYGGEWLEEITEGKFYAGTCYVSSTYMYNKVHVGYNARDYGKYKQGDTISFFIVSEYLNVN